MNFRFVFLPPQSDRSREWAARVAAELSEVDVVVAESDEDAAASLRDADEAFGTIPPELLRHANKLRWLQAPAAAPPAGYYYPELVRHPVVVTNFRGIFNDHIATHIMAYVLAFARGLHHYIPRQLRQEWDPAGAHSRVVHLPEATALIVGVGGIGGEAAQLCAAFGMRVLGVDARNEQQPDEMAEMHAPDMLDQLLPRADFVILTVPHTPQTEGMMHAERLAFTHPVSGARLVLHARPPPELRMQGADPLA